MSKSDTILVRQASVEFIASELRLRKKYWHAARRTLDWHFECAIWVKYSQTEVYFPEKQMIIVRHEFSRLY
jgi:hypothetical protein